jgi:hypothetical protein
VLTTRPHSLLSRQRRMQFECLLLKCTYPCRYVRVMFNCCSEFTTPHTCQLQTNHMPKQLANCQQCTHVAQSTNVTAARFMTFQRGVAERQQPKHQPQRRPSRSHCSAQAATRRQLITSHQKFTMLSYSLHRTSIELSDATGRTTAAIMLPQLPVTSLRTTAARRARPYRISVGSCSHGCIWWYR